MLCIILQMAFHETDALVLSARTAARGRRLITSLSRTAAVDLNPSPKMPRQAKKPKTSASESKAPQADPETSDLLLLSQLYILTETLDLMTRDEARQLDQTGLQTLKARVNALVKCDDARVLAFFTKPFSAAL